MDIFKKELKNTIDGKVMVRKTGRQEGRFTIYFDTPTMSNKEMIIKLSEKHDFKISGLIIQGGTYGFLYYITKTN